MTIQAAGLTALNSEEALASASAILDAGYEGIILENPIHQDAWQALLRLLPKDSVKALQLFVPYPRGLHPGSTRPYEAAAESPREREEAFRQARKTLEAADRIGAPAVLLPITQLNEPGLSWNYRPPTLAPDLSEYQLREASEEASQRMDSLLILLSRLLEQAGRYDLTICLAPSNRSGEFPLAKEALACLREFEGADMGLWLDSSRLPDEFLQVPRIGESELETLAEGSLSSVQGAFLRDRDPAGKACPPGQGCVPWELISKTLHDLPTWCISANDCDTIAGGLHFMAGLEGEPEEPGGLLGS